MLQLANPSDIIVRRFNAIETGTYQRQAARPYSAAGVNNDTLSRLHEQTMGGSVINDATVAGVAGNILRPSTEVGRDIHIANGWDTPRFRFIMELEEYIGTVKVIKIITGYTDHLGQTPSGALDPNMRLYFNSILKLQESYVQGAYGQELQYRVVENNHLLVNDAAVHGNNYNSQASTLRPCDIFGNRATHSKLLDMYGEEDGKVPYNLHDTRVQLASGAMKSDRLNSNHASYLSRTLRSYVDAVNTSADTDGMHNIFASARANVLENDVNSDVMLSTLDDEGGFLEHGYVTWGMLTNISPSLNDPSVTSFTMASQRTRALLPTAGQFEHVYGSGEETIVMSMLQNSLGVAMTLAKLARISFVVTNETVNGSTSVTLNDTPTAWTQMVNVSMLTEQFLGSLRSEVIPEVTGRGRLRITATINIDINGHSTYHISIDGRPAIPYCVPTFGDALTAPVIAADTRQIDNLAMDIDGVASALMSDTGTQSTQSSYF